MKNTNQLIDHSSMKVSESQKSIYQAIIQCKCPICTKGDMFKTGATNFARFNELKKNCEVCGFDFMPEPGFYQISMYFTYAINVAIFLIGWALTYLLIENPSLWVYLAAVSLPALIISPWNLRYSKVIMLYLFGDLERYKEGYSTSHDQAYP